MNTKRVVYMVTYKDDQHKTHITMVEGFSAVKFLEDRFDNVYFEKIENYPMISQVTAQEEFFIASFMMGWTRPVR